MIRLESCPFCGAKIDNFDMDIDHGVPARLTVRCRCGVEVTCRARILHAVSLNGQNDWFAPGGDAVEIWNRRRAGDA